MVTDKKYPKTVQKFKSQYRELVLKLVEIRKESQTNQDFIPQWLGVDRKRIIKFENLRKIDIELLLLYADKFSVDIDLIHNVN